jgi:hypothetical protein
MNHNKTVRIMDPGFDERRSGGATMIAEQG